ncbi:MAG TPA: uracil-DNA glycosylase [Planctomycetota bacterium]|nr:uracil-DNA glycosylase [Planctomycetota bacterium]
MNPERDELRALSRGLRGEARRGAWAGRRETRAPEQSALETRAPETRAPGAAAGGPARTSADVREQAAACADLASLARAVSRCEACELAKTRTQTVFMDGKGTRRVMFVGEAPGADEDRTGVPFVGRAGQLLTDIITKGMGIPREEVHIANVLKCRPPGNRDPTGAEKETCTPWLERQIALADPQVLVPLGKHAANFLLGLAPDTPMGASRGKVHVRAGRTLIPTYHPAYLLRSPAEKKECWKDIQVAMGILGITPTQPRA